MDVTRWIGKAVQKAWSVGGYIEDVFAASEVSKKLDEIPTHLGPYGTDPFGFDPQYLKRFAGIGHWLYRSYFRCITTGVQNLPDGKCFIVANHSGQLPFDGAMITMAVLLERQPPRFIRSMIERFVPSTPFISRIMARAGQVLGTPQNCRRLLQADESILVFPEGVRGLNKLFQQRYQLQSFGQGFMRLALETKSPIVPCAVIGAEEQALAVANFPKLGKALGLPAFPITLTHPWIPILGMLPYPTRYRIIFGEPISFEGNGNEEDEFISQRVEKVRAVIQGMLREGLKKRDGVFW